MSTSALVGTLVRRGMDAAPFKTGGSEDSPDSPGKYEMPVWGIVMLSGTVLLFLVVSTMIEYTYGRLIPALLMIESPPEGILFNPLPTEDNDDGLNKPGPEAEPIKPRPITSSFRTTLRLLRSKGGSRAKYRGFAIFLVNVFVMEWVTNMLAFLPFGIVVSPVIAAVLCTPLSVAWTHIVISEPSPRSWYHRMPSRKTWKKAILPTALVAVAGQVAVFVPASIALACGLGKTPEQLLQMAPHDVSVHSWKLLGIIGLVFIFIVVLVVPANVILTRVQASLLSDSEETIIPFDRSFDGKVVPELAGGNGAVRMSDAWSTFDWSARLRLIKAYAKLFLIQLALSSLLVATLVIQLSAIISKEDWKKIKIGVRNGGA